MVVLPSTNISGQAERGPVLQRFWCTLAIHEFQHCVPESRSSGLLILNPILIEQRKEARSAQVVEVVKELFIHTSHINR